MYSERSLFVIALTCTLQFSQKRQFEQNIISVPDRGTPSAVGALLTPKGREANSSTRGLFTQL